MTYRHAITGQIRDDITPEIMEAWIAAGNPKADGWEVVPALEPVPPEPRPYYHDDAESIDLDVSEAAQGRFTSLVTLVQVGTGLGVVTGETIQEIRDVHGAPHLLPVARLLPLMLRYGSHCAALFALSR